ncbi:hypothetical protein WJX72_004307 [[Myrmecia] bisecta]|uniref:MYND-type domain-containing protein n=1 Tax=[Myrmecia] bisecta TaxID=41462 RepID=A0AAW1PSU9_9CHLO
MGDLAAKALVCAGTEPWCKTAWFCGAQCQRDAWPTHKRFCRAYDVERKEQELQRLYEDGVRNITRSGVRGALDQLQAAADLATRQKNRMYEGLCAKWIATCYDRLDDHAKAQAFAEQALLIARELKDWKLEAESLIGLGLVMRKQQPEGWRRALIYFEVALSAARRHADVEVEASALGNIGAIRMMEDRAEGMRALMECASIREDMLNAAVAQFRLTGDSGPTTAAFHNYTTSLINLGGAAYLQGDWDFAIELYEKALTHAETLSDVERQCTILVNLANMSEVQDSL